MDNGYRGPDQGEADGLPTHGEPNFDETDLDESDQIGLTSVDLFTVQDVFPRDDEEMWNRVQGGHFDTEPVFNTNLAFIYASGPFQLDVGRTERFSMALLMGNDQEDLFRNEETVQTVFDANYNFARPPEKPLVRAIAGDRKVTLYWDSRAEESRDVFLNHKKDFEGYKVYRSTDPDFLEIKTITDVFGNPVYLDPLATFDLIDSISGPHPVGFNGIHYYMGDNSGLQHSYIDTTVENGRTYYYAVVSYDMGDAELGATGLLPTECDHKIRVDFNGNIETDINTAAVVPNAPPVGFRQAGVRDKIQHLSGPATGALDIAIFDPTLISDNNRYRVVFTDSGHLRQTVSYSIINITGGMSDTVVANSPAVNYDEFGLPEEGPLFDGMRMVLRNDTLDSVVDSLSGWIHNSSDFEVQMSLELSPPNRRTIYPATFEIRFFDSPVDSSFLFNNPANFEVWDVTDPDNPGKWDFIFAKTPGNTESFIQNGDAILPIFFEGDRRWANRRTTWRLDFQVDSTIANPTPPSQGDMVRLTATKRFRSEDVYEFVVASPELDLDVARENLDRIAVVPNPYVVTAAWEPQSRFASGRGERKIDFINVPPGSVIRIFTLSGQLVETLIADNSIFSGAVSWDLLSRDGMEIAFGVYVYHVEGPGGGEHLGKFAVIK